MACDGEIAEDELALIRRMSAEGMFATTDTDARLAELVGELNSRGHAFMKDYFDAVDRAGLDEESSLRLLRIAVATIYADNLVEYSEVKFFRAVRHHLHNITDEVILAGIPEIEDFWLESDVKSDSPDYLDSDYLDSITLPQFDVAAL